MGTELSGYRWAALVFVFTLICVGGCVGDGADEIDDPVETDTATDTASDTDTGCPDGDSDGVCDQDDGCPADADKSEPGVCGCGAADVDANGNGTMDCEEEVGCADEGDDDSDGIRNCEDWCEGDNSSGDYDSDRICDDLDPPPVAECVGAGTLEDSTYQLCWEQASSPFVGMATAQAHCDNLTLGGYTDWRLPGIDELRAIIEGCPDQEPGGLCQATDPTCLTPGENECEAGCNACTSGGDFLKAGLSSGDIADYTMSSSPAGGEYWAVRFSNAYITIKSETDDYLDLRCVRPLVPPCGDADGDGYCNEDDRCWGEDDGLDSDGDDNPDCLDVCPLDAGDDFDGDGLCAEVDPCPLFASDSCTMLEDFEADPASWPWSPWMESDPGNQGELVKLGAGHDGTHGLYKAHKWLYRTDTTFGTVVDQVLSMWCNPGTFANGGCGLGVGSDASGSYGFQLDVFNNVIEAIWTDYSGSETVYDFMYLGEIDEDRWYLMEIHAKGGAVFDLQVYADDGITPLGSLRYDFGTLSGNGVGIYSWGGSGDSAVDSLQLYSGSGQCIDIDSDGSCDADDLCEGDDSFGDADGDGFCGDIDQCDGNDWYGDQDTDDVCDAHVPLPDMPAFYDQHTTQEETAAGGACVEFAGVDGAPACDATSVARYESEINAVMAAHPFTAAVFDSATGGGQSFGTPSDAITCTGLPFDPSHVSMFDDLNADFHAVNDWKFSYSFVTVQFEWAVNVWEAVALYDARAQLHGGICELDSLVGAATGFHLIDSNSGWNNWQVLSTETCDYYGCRCAASLEVWISDTGALSDVCLREGNTCDAPYQGSQCLDTRFCDDIVELAPSACPNPV